MPNAIYDRTLLHQQPARHVPTVTVSPVVAERLVGPSLSLSIHLHLCPAVADRECIITTARGAFT